MSTSQQIQNLYHHHADEYDRHMEQTGHYDAQSRLLKRIASMIHEPVLDLACGSGFLLSKLQKHFSHITANDFSPKMIKLAKQNLNNENIRFTSVHAEILRGFQKAEFETIISCNLFFYIQRKPAAIQRWKSLLKRNGSIIFFEEYPFQKPSSRASRKWDNELMRLVDPISPKEITELMVRNGFKLSKKVKTHIDAYHDLYGLIFKNDSESV